MSTGRKTETEMERCYTKIHERERSWPTERRSIRSENMEIENLMPQSNGPAWPSG